MYRTHRPLARAGCVNSFSPEPTPTVQSAVAVGSGLNEHSAARTSYLSKDSDHDLLPELEMDPAGRRDASPARCGPAGGGRAEADQAELHPHQYRRPRLRRHRPVRLED